MRAPSDAQARVLRLVVEHADEGRLLLWRDRHDGLYAQLAYEEIDRTANTGRMVQWTQRSIRHASVTACIAREWVDGLHERDYTWGHGDRRTTDRFTELRLTDDGDLALGLWQHRKLHAPPPPAPPLSDEDRDVLHLAHEADRRGYMIVPARRTYGPAGKAEWEACRAQTRRLVKAGWAERTHPFKTTGIRPTATGTTEVADDPDAITTPPATTTPEDPTDA